MYQRSTLSSVVPDFPAAGPTEDSVDLWYMGYTPALVVASWMAHTGHNPDGTPIGRFSLPGQYGVTTAVYMFRDFLPIYYAGRPIPTFQRPGGLAGGQQPCPAPSPLPHLSRGDRTPAP